MPKDTTPIDPEEPVYMKHPDLDTIGGPVPRASFEGYWKPVKGWQEHKLEDSTVNAAIADVQARVTSPGSPLVETGLPIEDPAAAADYVPPAPPVATGSSKEGVK